MASCSECKWFFPLDEDPARGDCVRRESDEKSAYYSAKPVSADRASEECKGFESKA